MTTYQVTAISHDITEVEANSKEEAETIAYDIFKENGYNMLNTELDAEEEII